MPEDDDSLSGPQTIPPLAQLAAQHGALTRMIVSNRRGILGAFVAALGSCFASVGYVRATAPASDHDALVQIQQALADLRERFDRLEARIETREDRDPAPSRGRP